MTVYAKISFLSSSIFSIEHALNEQTTAGRSMYKNSFFMNTPHVILFNIIHSSARKNYKNVVYWSQKQ